VFTRPSFAMLVSTHWPVARSRRWIRHVREAAWNMSAHQMPSVYQSLLCGLSDVGGFVTPENDGPS
jgi:hypothetical protein